MTSCRVGLPFFWLIHGNKEFKCCASISWKTTVLYCWRCIMLSQVKPVCHQVQAEKKIIYWITHKLSKEQRGTIFLDTNMISKYQCQAGEPKQPQDSCAEKQKARKIWKLSSSCHMLVTCQSRKGLWKDRTQPTLPLHKAPSFVFSIFKRYWECPSLTVTALAWINTRKNLLRNPIQCKALQSSYKDYTVCLTGDAEGAYEPSLTAFGELVSMRQLLSAKGMASAQLIPLHSSCAIHREGPCGRCAGCSASGISFPLHSSTCLQLRIVYFLRNRKLWSELLEKCWPCQALQDRQHALGNSECLIQG